jgi:hypothetical protein
MECCTGNTNNYFYYLFMKRFSAILSLIVVIASCSKQPGNDPVPPPNFILNAITVNGASGSSSNQFTNVNSKPVIRLTFSEAVDRTSAANAISLKTSAGANTAISLSYENSDAVVVATPTANLAQFSTYTLAVANSLTAVSGTKLKPAVTVSISTGLDSTYKFPVITDNELLDKVQRVTFKYFWDFGHPVSGLARERSNGDNEVITSGGSGFGVMAMLAAVERNFISHADGLARMKKMVDFLLTKTDKFHGAFPHWLNGTSGAVIPFSAKDNGADLVETAYLIQGLLCARQYFNGGSAEETALRTDINKIWEAVEWDWFRKNNEDVLYWHWSPTYNWDMNLPIKGWNETLIVYALAASSPTHSIPKSVYDNGFASNGAMKNGKSYYNLQLPLGPEFGGPLFFAHYSFLGINPMNLADAYADYRKQNTNHALINYNYAITDPKDYGYSSMLWGLTASDIPNGYTASSPTNDVGVIAPTAALSSFPYTPAESMQALKFFYYVLGDKIWKENEYGFVDAFSIKDKWFANSYLAIDEGPIIVMIENYRSGLLWKLFMSCPEIKTGMKSLGFISPDLN